MSPVPLEKLKLIIHNKFYLTRTEGNVIVFLQLFGNLTYKKYERTIIMEGNFVVMFPDAEGRGLGEDFHEQIRLAMLPRPVVVPIINGTNDKEMDAIADKFRNEWCHPVVASATTGLKDVLVLGYQHVLQEYPDSVVIRLDASEHPIRDISRLAKIAMDTNGMVIGDLDFFNGFLRKGSGDELAHRYIFPEL